MSWGKILSTERCTMRALLETACLGFMTASLVVQPLAAAKRHPSADGSATLPSLADQKKWSQPMTEQQKALQLLNRITFGPRPGDLEQVQKMGLKAFLDEQLHPERLDDSAAEARLAPLPSLSMSTEELVENYPQPKPAALLAQAQQRAAQLAAQQSGQRPEFAPKPAPGAPIPEGGRKESTPGLEQPSNAMMQSHGRTGPDQTRNSVLPAKVQPARPMAPPQGPQGPQRVMIELAQEEILRAVYSNRQLQEVMVQFWMNHFNIFAPKGADRWMLTSFERDAIRPHALGKFEDLLVATAESPAMLFYLDNWLSATPNPTYRPNGQRGKAAPLMARRPYRMRQFGPPFGPGPFGIARPRTAAPRRFPPPGNAAKKPMRRGLNENYGRELMELHTLGVDGGYTQHDVTEVARCFTGWSIDRPQQSGGFIFRPQMHDYGQKLVLGQKIKSGRGMEDGLQVLHILAHHPSTAHFISLELCRRFVADDPPPALVNRAAKTFLKTKGDIRQVLKTILTSPEFYSEAAYRAKVKSPFELMASSLRALGAQTDASPQLIFLVARMGQPMFQYLAPTGYPDRASAWINSGLLLTRINFAAMLAANRIQGTTIDWNALAPAGADPASRDQTEFVQDLAQRLVAGDLTQKTRQAIQADLIRPAEGAPPAAVQRERVMVAGLLLASPEFQRR